MKMKIKGPNDFYCGVMFIIVSSFFLIMARTYEIGSAMRMGPAYFPIALASLISILGGILIIRSFILKGEKVARLYFRPKFLITISVLTFGLLLESLGMVFSVTLLISISIFAGRNFQIKEAIIFTFALVFFTVLLFNHGLRIVLPIWPRFFY
jgi:hypothetical protein